MFFSRNTRRRQNHTSAPAGIQSLESRQLMSGTGCVDGNNQAMLNVRFEEYSEICVEDFGVNFDLDLCGEEEPDSGDQQQDGLLFESLLQGDQQEQQGCKPDFDALIELIKEQTQNEDWENDPTDLGQTLELVNSQTEQVHEQIADLLQSLRRLQDLQVTIEVRFITLQDDFFEQIGVDFDFDINDQINGGGLTGQSGNNNSDKPADPLDDLDVSFGQGSFDIGVPDFGDFDPNKALQFGSAILSDIETFFFMNAAQGDTRDNVMFAPKVTLFEGQIAQVR